MIWALGRRGGVLLLTMVMFAGCAAKRPGTYGSTDPDLRLDWLLGLIEENYRQGTSCQEEWRSGHSTVDCDRIYNNVEKLAMEFPTHDRILMANALLAYESGKGVKAQQYLDQLLSRRRVYPEAALLRARIAVEEGNLRFAQRMLEEQVAIAPDHSGLHELLAATYYLHGDYDRARSSLDAASRLGAPAWRVAYHYGLISEAFGSFDEARLHYTECMNRNPDYQPALSRMMALSTTPIETGKSR